MQDYIEAFGCIEDNKVDIRDYIGISRVSAQEFPFQFELNLSAPKSQGNVGSCVAHSLATIVEYFNRNQENSDTAMSTGYIYGNRTKDGYKASGMSLQCALKTILEYGDVPYKDFPENIETPEAIQLFEERAVKLIAKGYPNRLSSYYRLKTVDDMKASLQNNGPIIVSMGWYATENLDPETGVMNMDVKGAYRGCHCVVIYGWNEIGWLMQNSWGEKWGKNGRAIIPYRIFDACVKDCFGVIDTISTARNDAQIKGLQEKITELQAEIDTDNAVFNNLKEQMLLKKTQIAENDKLIKQYLAQIQELTMAKDSQLDQINELTFTVRSLTDKNSEYTNLLYDYNTKYLELEKEISDKTSIIEQQNEQIDLLNIKLLEIEKPYKNMPKWLVSIINFILNIFS